MALQQAQIESMKSKSMADQGLGIERASRVEENRALYIQRIAEDKKDQEIGLLNLVKALKEIDTVDIEHVEKLIALSRLVKEPIESAAMQQVPTQNSSAVGS